MAQVQFLFLGNFPKNVINLRATLWVARRAAAQIDPSITRILIKLVLLVACTKNGD